MKATTINIGKSNTSVNVVSGIFNASNFILYSGNKVNPLNTTCFLDTIVASSGVRQLGIGIVNAHEVYIGVGSQNTKVDIGSVPNTANTINIGNASSAITMGYFNLSSINFNGFTNSCLLDTSIKGTLTTQMHLGLNNAEEIFIGNGRQNKKVDIGTVANTANTINIGNASSTITVGGKMSVDGSNYPLVVKHNSDYGLAIKPIDGTRIKRGNISIWGTFDTNGFLDYTNRRCCDIYGGFSGGAWNTEYMSFGVGSEWVSPYTNDASTPTIERMRINATGLVSITGDLTVGGDIKLPRYKGIAFNNGIGNTNTLHSYIVDDGELHVCTDNNMFFKIGCTNFGGVNYGTTVMTIVSSGVSVTGIKMGGGKTITCFDAGSDNATDSKRITFSTTFPTIPVVQTQIINTTPIGYILSSTISDVSTTGFTVYLRMVQDWGFYKSNFSFPNINFTWTAISYS